MWWSYIWLVFRVPCRRQIKYKLFPYCVVLRLNEGFAALYERLLHHMAYPEDRAMDLFIVETVHGILDTDANPNIRAMTHYVDLPSQIMGLFDGIAYAKCKPQ